MDFGTALATAVNTQGLHLVVTDVTTDPATGAIKAIIEVR